MTQNTPSGSREQRERGMNPQDQSLDRGYGGLPGKQAGDDSDDKTLTRKPAKDKIRSDERKPETTTKH